MDGWHSISAAALLIAQLLCATGLVSPGYGATVAPSPQSTTTEPSVQAKTESDAFFASQTIPVIKIQLSENALRSLRREPRTYVQAKIQEGSNTYENVGIHLKGAAGSFRDVDNQPALTLNFDKFKKGQKFHGLDKLHLNNSVQDPSYLTELICSELFLEAGVPATRVSHAAVELNGRRLGLYVLKEGFGKPFLKRHFANVKGNLYDDGFLRDITETLERISGTEEGQPAVERLVRACEISNPQLRRAELERRLDVERFLSFIVVEMMTWHWDGYLMKANNYRLYHDPDSDRIVFLPHGMDQMFWSPNGTVSPSPQGLVAASLLTASGMKARYRARAAELTTNVFIADRITARIRSVAGRIRPVLAQQDAESATAHDAAVKNLARQVTQRAAYLRRILTEAAPTTPTFNAEGEAELSTWRTRIDAGAAQFRRAEEGGRQVLVIEAASSEPPSAGESPEACLASYRSVVLLEPGRYQLSGRMRTEKLVPISNSVRGSGAGLRISQRRRQQGLVNDSGWQEMRYEFIVGEQEEIELICDLRAQSGSAYFDAGSLRLKRLPAQPDPATKAAP